MNVSNIFAPGLQGGVMTNLFASKLRLILCRCALLLLCLLACSTGPDISQCKAQTCGPWSEPVNVAYPINTEFNDTYAILSRDGLTMYFTSDRPGGLGGDDLWVAKRESLSDPWQVPTNMGVPINTAANDSLPVLSSDEHVMFFPSTRRARCRAAALRLPPPHA